MVCGTRLAEKSAFVVIHMVTLHIHHADPTLFVSTTGSTLHFFFFSELFSVDRMNEIQNFVLIGW